MLHRFVNKPRVTFAPRFVIQVTFNDVYAREPHVLNIRHISMIDQIRKAYKRIKSITRTLVEIINPFRDIGLFLALCGKKVV